MLIRSQVLARVLGMLLLGGGIIIAVALPAAFAAQTANTAGSAATATPPIAVAPASPANPGAPPASTQGSPAPGHTPEGGPSGGSTAPGEAVVGTPVVTGGAVPSHVPQRPGNARGPNRERSSARRVQSPSVAPTSRSGGTQAMWARNADEAHAAVRAGMGPREVESATPAATRP
jgi:hypothetical protein